MKFFLISDNIDTQIGLQLVGVKGIVVHQREEILKELSDLKKRDDVGILILTEKIAELIPQELKEMRLSKKLPLVTLIPDRHGSKRPENFITKYVQEAIGVRLE